MQASGSLDYSDLVLLLYNTLLTESRKDNTLTKDRFHPFYCFKDMKLNSGWSSLSRRVCCDIPFKYNSWQRCITFTLTSLVSEVNEDSYAYNGKKVALQ